MYISIYHSFRNIVHHWVFQKFLQYIIKSHKEPSRIYTKTNFIQMKRGWVGIIIWSLLLDMWLQINLETSLAPVWWFMNNQICNYFLSNCDDLGIRWNNHERHNQKIKKSGFFSPQLPFELPQISMIPSTWCCLSKSWTSFPTSKQTYIVSCILSDLYKKSKWKENIVRQLCKGILNGCPGGWTDSADRLMMCSV